MARTNTIVATCSAGIVVLFIVSCYLMSIVNPEIDLSNSTAKKTIDVSGRLSDHNDYLYPSDELSAKDNVHYGLEKVPDDYEFKTTYTTEDSLDAPSPTPFAIPIPVFVPTARAKSTAETGAVDEKLYGRKSVTLMIIPLKENKRMVRDKSPMSAKYNNVLLKIVDDIGQARMAVIVDPVQLSSNGFSKMKSDLRVEDNVYEIKPNNTLLYNIHDQSFEVVDNVATNADNTSFRVTKFAPKNVTYAFTSTISLINVKRLNAVNTSLPNVTVKVKDLLIKNTTSSWQNKIG